MGSNSGNITFISKRKEYDCNYFFFGNPRKSKNTVSLNIIGASGYCSNNPFDILLLFPRSGKSIIVNTALHLSF